MSDPGQSLPKWAARAESAFPLITDEERTSQDGLKRATNGLTLTRLLRKRILEEETHHFPRCVRSSRIGVGARRTTSRPCVSSSVDVPVLKDSAPTGVGMDRAGIGMPSRYPPAMHLLLGGRRSHRLLKNMIAVAWMHRNVAITMKNNSRDGGPFT